jgi:hypothetical protein
MHHGGSVDYVMGVKAISLQNTGISAVLILLAGLFALAFARGIVAPVKLAGATSSGGWPGTSTPSPRSSA